MWLSQGSPETYSPVCPLTVALIAGPLSTGLNLGLKLWPTCRPLPAVWPRSPALTAFELKILDIVCPSPYQVTLNFWKLHVHKPSCFCWFLLPRPSRLLAANPALRNNLGKESGNSSQNLSVAAHWDPLRTASSSIYLYSAFRCFW